MKRIHLILLALWIAIGAFAQSPQKISYQAIIRDNNGQTVNNHAVAMRVSLLQGSISGTNVYTETHNLTSTANGSVSTEIGGGLGFSSINWANGPFFIKTETDPTGGTNYTITGVSQLLSVPYAFYTEIADKLNERDPSFNASPAVSITANNITRWDTAYHWGNHATKGYIKSLTEADTLFKVSVAHGITTADTIRWNHKPTQLTAGTGINITNNVISAKTYHIGDFAQGGIVFWLDETGQHGLVCAKQDQSTYLRWHTGTYGLTQAKGDGPMAGETNTEIILAALVHIGDDGSSYAARICNELQITENGYTYGDWYLPSKEELYQMYLNMAAIDATALANGGTAFPVYGSFYYSSTEFDIYNAWYVAINPNATNNPSTIAKNNGLRVRAVRAF